jgi:chemotaxis protein MotB
MGKKKKTNNEDPDVDIGPVMVVSLFLILLTFFIMLNSIAVLDDRRIRISIGSILGAFGGFTGGYSASKSGELVLPPSSPMVTKSIDLSKIMGIPKGKMIGAVSIESKKDRAIITFNRKYLFVKDSLELKDSARRTLNKLCDFIKQEEYPVDIVGHTDNLSPIQKGYQSNWELSAMMAQQLFQYFSTQGKISNMRLSAYGSGSHSPIIQNDTPGTRAQNRRVDIILKHGVSSHIKRMYKNKPSNIFTHLKFDFKVFK